MELPRTERIEFFFDPLCPWAWITSRFMVETAEHRPLDITWRLISLAVLNEGEEQPPPYDRVPLIGTENMRVLAAVARAHTNTELGSLYSALGERLHTAGRSSELFGDDATDGAHLGLMSEALAETGLAASLIERAHDTSLDGFMRGETHEALSRTGDDVGTPVVTYDPADPMNTTYFGPVIDRIPRGEEAVALFEAVAGFALTDGVIEIKRTIRGDPRFD